MITSFAELKNTWEVRKKQRHAETHKHVTIKPSSAIIHDPEGDKIYVPSRTGNLFHQDDSFVRVVMGPYGSGKSTMAVHEIVRRTCAMPVWAEGGRRRARWAIVRNTSGELQTTTLQTWIAWFGSLGDISKRQKPVMTYEHRFNDGKGIVELELIFIALDRPDDVKKLKSLELTGCYINEMSEVPYAALAHMKGRVNRYPSRAFCNEAYWSGIIGDTNPPDEDHWIHRDFEQNTVEGHRIFRQPPGLLNDDGSWIRNPDADNADHLPDDYYVKLSQGQSSEFVKVFCLGEYGSVGSGRRVYPEFNPDFHAVDKLEAIQGHPLVIGWDFGLTPACVVMQLTPRGQLLVLKEYVAEGMGIRTFAESVVIPGIARDFTYCKIGKSVADPAGNSRSEIMEEMSCIGELNSLGIETTGASTNDIPPRLASVRYFLNRMTDGKPAFLIDRSRCPVLFKGFAKDYIYMRVAVAGEERYKDKPHKNMSSHPMDALGYGCLELASEQISVDRIPQKIVDVWNPVPRIF